MFDIYGGWAMVGVEILYLLRFELRSYASNHILKAVITHNGFTKDTR